MVLSLKNKIFFGFGLLTIGLACTAGFAVYALTRPLEVDFAQDPNAVEAHEADRKLKLFNEAQASRRQGFVRLSEVEINSFLDGRYNSAKNSRTNDPVKLVKSGVLLGASDITFVTWHQAPLLGFKFPFVWQRVISPVKETNGWTFNLHSMQVGNVNVPPQHWARVNDFFGGNDSLFEDRKVWLRNLPLVTMAHNEQSKSPEIRLYTYLPKEKAKHSEPASE